MSDRNGTAPAVPFFFDAALAGICLIAAARVALTYGILGQTFDEPAHAACGLEIAATGRYTLELQHPPLARIATGIGLRIGGLTPPEHGADWQRGNENPHSGGRAGSKPHPARAAT